MTTGIGWEHEVDERSLAWLDAHAVNICAVILRTERDADGVHYEVHVRDALYDCTGPDDDNTREIWSRSVAFGSGPNKSAGGVQFIAAALDQEDCAQTMWRRHRDAVKP